jgi:DNA helicase-4
LRKKFNAAFVSSELKKYNAFFDNIEGRKLDEQQRTAVVTDEDNNLIIAGAGSGKTTTIVGKVHYILDKYKVKPEEVLLISFTKDSAVDLRDRISIDSVEVKTFHKFGLDILADVEKRKPSTFEDYKFEPLLTKLFKEKLKEQKYIKKVNVFTTEYLQQPKSQFSFDTKGEYYQYLREQNFKTFKYVESPGLTTLQRETVKSIEECKIANFLLFNGVDYKYELKYQYVTSRKHRQYKPDFSLFQDGKRIYLEHFGINKDGQVPPFFANDGETRQQASKRYTDEMEWKRDLHKEKSTVLIETYSHEMWRNDEIFYDKLKQRLIDAGIKLNQKTPDEIWEIINKFYQREEKNLIELFSKFIVLMKSNQCAMTVIKEKAGKLQDRFLRKRSQLFLDIIEPIYDGYELHLAKEKEIDFSDMINKATEHIAKRKYKKKISYLIIDEFQDISIGRYNLVKEIKKANPSCRMFCVGDDWQSIYRFTGSDIALFKDFKKYFGVTEQLKIETTYRFHNPLIDLSSKFIQQNPNQAKKDLRSANSKLSTNYQIRYSRNDDTETLVKIFNELIDKYDDIENKDILILAGHNRDLSDRVKNEDKVLLIKTGQRRTDGKRPDVNVSYQNNNIDGDLRRIKANFKTIHRSKGLEADIVIILRCNTEVLGIPNQMADDSVLNLLLSEADQFENGEERRLFYVAMTRAKEMLYFVTDSYKKSKFILEIETESGQGTQMKCPICKTGDININQGVAKITGNRFIGYGCSNWRYKCPGKGMVFENQPEWIEDDWIKSSQKNI